MTKIAETYSLPSEPKEVVTRTEGVRSKREGRRERAHFGTAQSKLAVYNADPKYHYHWINDIPGRVDWALAVGYEFVTRSEVELNPGVTPRNSDPGDKVSAVVGRQEDSNPLRAYLMKIPLELYEEDQALAQEKVDQVDNAIRHGRVTGDTASEDFYQPRGERIKMNSELTKRKD